MDHQKSNFSLISDTLPVRGCWGQTMLLFWKMVDETQMGNPRDHAAREILSKFSILLLLRAVYFRSFLYETQKGSPNLETISVDHTESWFMNTYLKNPAPQWTGFWKALSVWKSNLKVENQKHGWVKWERGMARQKRFSGFPHSLFSAIFAIQFTWIDKLIQTGGC